MCRLVPAPRGTGIVAAPASKRMLQLAGIQDCYTQSQGSTSTMGNFIKVSQTIALATERGETSADTTLPLPPCSLPTQATFEAVSKTYAILTPNLWPEIPAPPHLFVEHAAHLQRAGKKTVA